MPRLATITALLLLAAVPAAADARPRELVVAKQDGTLEVVRAASGVRAQAAARRPGVRFVEPNHRFRATGVASDALFAQQWSLADDAVLGAQRAWDQTTGGEVVVAVIDSGVDLRHPDLRDNLWANPGEVPGNGADDDGNGRVDDVHGFDFVAGDGDPSDDNGHGTHVAGIAAARGGNGIGVAGVAWRARIMALKALDANGSGSTFTVAEAVRYAVGEGARVINLSLSGPGRSQALEEALRAASDAGVLVVASAGNSGADLAGAPEYPAAFELPRLVTVAATAQDGGLAAFSNRGGTTDLAAPGQAVISTGRGGAFERRSGTSMAAPHVAGALVLLAAARPDLPAEALQAALLEGARRTGQPVGAGSLDVAAALRRLVPAAAWRAPVAAAPAPATAAPARSAPAAKAGPRAKAKPKAKPRAGVSPKPKPKAKVKPAPKAKRTCTTRARGRTSTTRGKARTTCRRAAPARRARS